MRVLIDAAARWSGGYLSYLKGILSSGAIPTDVEVIVLCSSKMAKILGTVDPQVELTVDEELLPSIWYQYLWRKKKLPKLIRRYNPDIHFNPLGFLEHYNSISIPRVTMSHNIHPFTKQHVRNYGLSKERLKLEIKRIAQIASFEHADGVIFLSDYACQVVVQQAKVKFFKTIPHGIGAEFFFEPRDTFPLENGIVRLLYISSVWLYKNQWHVITAVEQLRKTLGIEIRIDLIGEGEPIALFRLQKRINELGSPEYIRYSPGIPHEKIPEVLRANDIFVFASSCETFGITLLEAMAAGLPIACSEKQPMADILKNGGVYFNPESPRSIAKAIKILIEEPKVRSRCSRQSNLYAREYSWRRCSIETFKFLKEVLVNSRNNRRYDGKNLEHTLAHKKKIFIMN